MEGVTLVVGALGGVLVYISRPIYCLIVYIAALAWYPSYLTVSIGTIDFTVSRIIVIVIFVKLFLQTDLPKRFKFIWLDKLIIIYFAAQILAGATTAGSMMAFLENRAGAVFDTVLPYFAVRLIVISRKAYLTLLKSILIIAAPLAIIGLYQCLTGNNPFGFLEEYNAWKAADATYRPIARHGFYRADVTFTVSIMYGLFFAMFGPICAGILCSTNKNKMLCWFGLGLMGVGVFSSMSSGPWVAVMLSFLFIAFYRWRKYWKPVIIIFIVICISVEIISNRHFYDVLGGFTLDPTTAWYRSKLIDIALFEGGMSGHWVTGFGIFTDPGWGLRIDGRTTDVVNHYMVILVYYGLIGFVPFIAICILVVKRLVDAYKASLFDSDKRLAWCLSGAFFGLGIGLACVSLFGQPAMFFHIMLGLCGSMPIIVSWPNPQMRNKI